MAKITPYYYLVDKMNRENMEVLKKSLKTVPEISEVFIRLNEGIIDVRASKEVEQQVKMACQVAGTTYR
ncbi:MAG: hypothetical protein AB1798_11120, partial [Spirochaetota bacterium]